MLSVMGCQNPDEETNRYYSGQRGEHWEKRIGGGISEPEQLPKQKPQRVTESRNYHFQPAPDLVYYAYLGLRRGGLENAGEIGVILTMQERLKGTTRRWLRLSVFQECPRWTKAPESLVEWVLRWKWRWNNFTSRNCFVWLDSNPRLRIWIGHEPFGKVIGWLIINPKRGFMLLSQWACFWFLGREKAVRLREQYNATYQK